MNIAIAGRRDNAFEIEVTGHSFYLQVGRKSVYAEIQPPFSAAGAAVDPRPANYKWADYHRDGRFTQVWLGRFTVMLTGI